MKKVIFFLSLLVGLAASATPIIPIKVDERIQKLFAETFPQVQGVTWYGSDTHYEAVFCYQAAQCRITYRLDGAVERLERYYTAEELAPFVRARVQSKYAGYRIHGVTEITTEMGLLYYIVLEGREKWLQVEADETGHTYVIKRFNRQPAAATAKSN